jgi:hypothetical protein
VGLRARCQGGGRRWKDCGLHCQVWAARGAAAPTQAPSPYARHGPARGLRPGVGVRGAPGTAARCGPARAGAHRELGAPGGRRPPRAAETSRGRWHPWEARCARGAAGWPAGPHLPWPSVTGPPGRSRRYFTPPAPQAKAQVRAPSDPYTDAPASPSPRLPRGSTPPFRAAAAVPRAPRRATLRRGRHKRPHPATAAARRAARPQAWAPRWTPRRRRAARPTRRSRAPSTRASWRPCRWAASSSGARRGWQGGQG